MQITLATTDEAIQACHPLMQELRPHLERNGFLARIRELEAEGYRLAVLREQGVPSALAGFRIGDSLAWGRHLYVDDLVTLPGRRSKGYGAALLDWLRTHARDQGCRQLHLDCGLQRLEAHRFYTREGMEKGGYHFVEQLEPAPRPEAAGLRQTGRDCLGENASTGNRLHHVRLLADYNRWMNEQLYAACARIPDAERKRDLGAFFRSIQGTFNHLLLGDRLWMGRLTGEPFTAAFLAQELYPDFDELRREREKEDRRISAWVAELSEDDLDRVVGHVSVADGQPRRFRVEDILIHLYHHQTHHRGQVTTLISRLGHDFGETDLIFMPGMPVPAG